MDYEISVSQLKQQLSSPNPPLLLDVREQWEFDTAHIAGAKLMPMGDIPSRVHQELNPDDRLLILCHHGARSLSVTNWLRQQGFEAAQHAPPLPESLTCGSPV